VLAVLKIIFALGFKEPGRGAFWSFLGRLLWRHPQCFPLGISIATAGFHYRMITHQFCAAPCEPAPQMITVANLQKEPFSHPDQQQELTEVIT
jgi:hypothetical protein